MSTGIGEVLRAARRRQGASLADAAAETRVRESYLAALEEEDYAALGGHVYVKGFLRSYARFLGLDPEPLLERFRESHQVEDETAPFSGAPGQPMLRERQAGVGLVAGAAAVIIVLLLVLGLRVGRDSTGTAPTLPQVPPPVSATSPALAGTPTATAPADGNAAAVDPEATAEPAIVDGDSVEVLVRTAESAWVRVIADGDIVLASTLPAGASRSFTAQESLSLRIGDAAAVSLVVNGEERSGLGERGEVVELEFRTRAAG